MLGREVCSCRRDGRDAAVVKAACGGEMMRAIRFSMVRKQVIRWQARVAMASVQDGNRREQALEIAGVMERRAHVKSRVSVL